MIISSQQVKSIIQLNRATYGAKRRTAEAGFSSKSLDTFELSGRAQELQQAKDQVLKSSDSRADRITELKNQIREGTYQVSSGDIAQKMLGRFVADELAGR